MQEGIKVLIERMDSHPEEFFGDLAFRWSEIMQDIAKHGAEFLEEDDLMMLNKKVKEVRRKEFNAKVLDEIASAQRLNHAKDKAEKLAQSTGNYGASVKQSGAPIKAWWNDSTDKMNRVNKAFDQAYHDYSRDTITLASGGNIEWASERADVATINRIRMQNHMLEMELAAVKQAQAEKDAKAQAYKKRKNQGWFSR